MIVRNIYTVEKTRVVEVENWQSTRLILSEDRMGFSFHITVMHAGTETKMWYKNHLESCYCLDGHGQIEDLETGKVHDLYPGVIYILDQNDRHVVRPQTDITIACVFNPALVGTETHRFDGSYAVASGREN